MEQRTCAFDGCNTLLVKKPGRGRWPKWCAEHKPVHASHHPSGYMAPSKRAQCSECGKDVYRSRTSADHPLCRECRLNRAKHGTAARYGRGCRCEACTAAVAAYGRDYRKRRAESGNPVRRKYRRLVCRKCMACGSDFNVPAYVVEDGFGLYCSRRCANLAKLNLPWDSVPNPELHRRGHWIDLPDRLAIYERDNWTCHLCGLPVNPNADVQDGDYPTLDHLVPWSTQLVPDNSPSNLKCAHRSCNSRRGVMSVDEYRSRFGTRSAA